MEQPNTPQPGVSVAAPPPSPPTDTPAVAPTPAPSGGDRPAWLPEKFQTAEDMAKAYAELEAKQSRPAEIPPEDSPTEEPTAEDESAAEDGVDPYGEVVSSALQQAGLEADEVNQHFINHGQISEQHYAKLKEAGFSRDVVDVYLNGLRAMSQEAAEVTDAQIDTIYNSVGGKAEYVKMARWAHTNLPDRGAEFDRLVSMGDNGVAQMAVANLHAQYTAAVGAKPKLVQGNAPQQDGGSRFSSVEEMKDAMKDKRYGKDPAYTNDVETKVARSGLFDKRR